MAADEVRDGQRGQITGLEGSGKEVGESTLGAMGNYWNVLGKAVTWSDDGFRRLFCIQADGMHVREREETGMTKVNSRASASTCHLKYKGCPFLGGDQPWNQAYFSKAQPGWISAPTCIPLVHYWRLRCQLGTMGETGDFTLREVTLFAPNHVRIESCLPQACRTLMPE